jgi:glycosyltransferase involved in cell wall biosynthesis
MDQWPDDTAILIPAYKAASLLEKVLPDVMRLAAARHIIIVDDASEDATPEVCKRNSILCLTHPENTGKGGALATGFSHCIRNGYKWVITMDADGQHAPDDLPRFIAAAKSSPKPGICIGARMMQPGIMPFERIISNRMTSAILGFFCRIPIRDSQCGYRLYNINLLKKITISYNRFEMESEIIMKAAFLGFPVIFTNVQTLYFKGPSHIAHAIDTVRWIAAVLNTRLQRRRIIRQSTANRNSSTSG